MSASSITSLYVVQLAEEFADFTDLFSAECDQAGHPLTEAQCRSFTKTLIVQLQGASERFREIAEVDAILAARPVFVEFKDDPRFEPDGG